jgi:hypothetical protein
MAPIKLTTTMWRDSTLPRDGMSINPVFNTTAGTTDAKSLVDDWMVAFKGWSPAASTCQVTIKAYDISKPKPNYPLYERTDNPNVATPANCPRELALCLSFYAGTNTKRRRGRLYLPADWLALTGTLLGRPSQTAIDKVMSLGPILCDLGALDVDWSVYSKVDGSPRAVTNYWCDNEWDVQRSRGLRGTARSEATTTEETAVVRAIAP